MSESPARPHPLSYGRYLMLDQLLASQAPESAKTAAPAHDEMLFIIVHQTYELWFKQILHEVAAVMQILGQEFVPDRELGRAVHLLDRVTTIQGLLVEQISILETMTPLDFLDFRNLLTPSSGFQSAQFRRFETLLGLRRQARLMYNAQTYEKSLDAEDRPAAERVEGAASLYDLVERWLARMPFTRYQPGGAGEAAFDFWRAYREAVLEMLEADRETIEQKANLNASAKTAQLAGLANVRDGFELVFDPNRYAGARGRGERRLSYDAFLAALMISLYRDEPILQTPFRLLTLLVDIDERLALWRYRHMLMVNRMIGGKIGTGGSSGEEYLKRTVDAHRIYTDFFNLSTFLIPRSLLPRLPAALERELGFRWTA